MSLFNQNFSTTMWEYSGKKLKEARIAAGFKTQEQFADRCGYSQARISDLEYPGRVFIQPHVKEILEQALKEGPLPKHKPVPKTPFVSW